MTSLKLNLYFKITQAKDKTIPPPIKYNKAGRKKANKTTRAKSTGEKANDRINPLYLTPLEK
jgi:hypothetical protein